MCIVQSKYGKCRTASTSSTSTSTPPPALQQPAQQALQLNWSHFKPKCSGKPEDTEAHLLRPNNWIDTHQFQEGVKVQWFWLTLVREARVWYGSLRPINIDWQGLPNQFR